jgi:hypothetical protein
MKLVVFLLKIIKSELDFVMGFSDIELDSRILYPNKTELGKYLKKTMKIING